MHVTTGTVVLIRLHKKVGLRTGDEVNCTKDRKICADENKLWPGKERML